MAHANPVDLEQFTPVLKNVYLPFRKKAFPMLTVLLAQVRKGGPETVKYSGNDLFFDVKFGRRGGFSASALGYFPQSKIAREKQGRLGITRLYAQVAVDGLALKTAQGDKATYISVAKKVTEDIMDQWQLEQNRIAYGDGRAIRAIIQAVTDTDTIIVHYPYGITNAGPGNLHLEDGDDIAVIANDTLASRGKARISSHTLSGDLCTLELSTTIANMAATDFIVTAVPTAVHATDSSFGAEPYGTDAICDPAGTFATFEGLADDRWVAYNTTATAVDEMTLTSFLNVIRARGGVDWRQNPKAMLLITSTGIWQTYGESLLGLRRFSAPEMTLNGGFKAVQVANCALVDDPWAPRGRITALHTPDLVNIDLMDFALLGYEDSPKWTMSATQDVFTATYGYYGNFGCLMRNTHGTITGITDTVNYSPVF